MAFAGRDIVNWTVAFYGQPRNAWERLWFRPGFRHCIAFAWVDADRWLELDPRLPRIRVRILTGPQYTRRRVALDRLGGMTVSAIATGGERRVPRVATCAGTIAHVLGVRGALLPYQLYRALTSIEAER